MKEDFTNNYMNGDEEFGNSMNLPFEERPENIKRVKELKKLALKYLKDKGVEKDWLEKGISRDRALDGIIADMRHVEGGQIYILEQLREVAPRACWFRGGTLKTFREVSGFTEQNGYTTEELSTYTIDGGGNGVIENKALAEGFMNLSHSLRPVLYSLTVDALIEGIKKNAISLWSEHGYDLCISMGSDRHAYLEFCKKYLKKVITLPPKTS